MTRWYRAYSGTVRDDKLGECAIIAGCSRSIVIATWHAILESAADTADGGRFETTPRRVAALLVEPAAAIEAVFAAMTEVDLIRGGIVTAWKKRQFESDSSTERSRKHREAKRNGDATLRGRCATPPEAETDTEIENTGLSTQPVAGARASKDLPPIDVTKEPMRTRIAVASAFHGAGLMPPDTTRVVVWLEQGYTPAEIEAVIGDSLARGRKPGGLKYFDQALAEIRALPIATGPPRHTSRPKGEGMAALDAFITEMKDRNHDNRSESRTDQAPVLRLAAGC